ncbi:MAG: hypothetical protein GY778_16355 [bacterium]|nr:hypothetical protein [bacterium]
MNDQQELSRSSKVIVLGVAWVHRRWTRVGAPHGSRSTGTHATQRDCSIVTFVRGAGWRNLIWVGVWLICGCGGSRGDWFGDRKHQHNNSEATATDARPAPNASNSTESGAAEAGRQTVANRPDDSGEPAESLEPVDVLHVNEDRLTVDEVLAPLHIDFSARVATVPPERYWSYVDQTLRTRIRGMVRDLLLYQEASRRLTQQENEMIDQFTDQRIRNQVQEQHGGRQVRWERAMADRGLSPEEARQQVRKEVVIYAYLERTVKPRVQEPTRRELLRIFEERSADMTVPERRELFLIEVPIGDDRAVAQAAADRALEELAEGTDFATVARKYSGGIHAADGGAWGMVTPHSIRGRWAAAADTLRQLQPAETSPVIEAEGSFFIVHLGRVEPRRDPDFAAVQMSLKAAYREQQFNLLIEEKVLELQERARIRPEDPSRFLRGALEACPRPAE